MPFPHLVIDEMREHKRAWRCVCQACLLTTGKIENSPYINHFIQPDTIIPDLSNPQTWNRYSYVTNRPVNFNDPTGHVGCDGDYQGSCLDWAKSLENQEQGGDGPDPDDELILKTGLGNNSCVDNACTIPFLPFDPWVGWTTNSYPWDFPVYDSWGHLGPMEINPMDFELMLKAVGEDLQGFPTFGWYDTPFYDHGGDLTGTAYINGSYYDRSELNYIGEGEALAKIGLSRDATQTVVFLWKNKKSLLLGLIGLDSTTKPVTQGTKDMTDIGWYYYTDHYSGNP